MTSDRYQLCFFSHGHCGAIAQHRSHDTPRKALPGTNPARRSLPSAGRLRLPPPPRRCALRPPGAGHTSPLRARPAPLLRRGQRPRSRRPAEPPLCAGAPALCRSHVAAQERPAAAARRGHRGLGRSGRAGPRPRRQRSEGYPCGRGSGDRGEPRSRAVPLWRGHGCVGEPGGAGRAGSRARGLSRRENLGRPRCPGRPSPAWVPGDSAAAGPAVHGKPGGFGD